jgi:hypothetical protein
MIAELNILLSALADCLKVHNELVSSGKVTGQDPIQVMARMSGYIEESALPITKAVAAEHMAYLYNRDASDTVDHEEAEKLYAVAMACAHYAYEVSGRDRHAKYVAQNLLEVAQLRGSGALRALAEMLWIDAYFVPNHLGLHVAAFPFTSLGWQTPVHVSAPTINWEDIPSYAADPDFVYDGRAR